MLLGPDLHSFFEREVIKSPYRVPFPAIQFQRLMSPTSVEAMAMTTIEDSMRRSPVICIFARRFVKDHALISRILEAEETTYQQSMRFEKTPILAI